MDAYQAAIALLAQLTLEIIHNQSVQPNPENIMNGEAIGHQSGEFGESL